jgi:NosR/NirI family nitrous oxide reductase transcriptional regulator
MVMYYDDNACPPMVKERKKRTAAGKALTPINDHGYFISLDSLRSTLKERRPAARQESL